MKVYPNGFQGKQLSLVDQKHLLSIAACLWVKSEMRSRNFIDDSISNSMLATIPNLWCLSVSVDSSKISLHINVDLKDNGYFTVHLRYGVSFITK